MKYEEARTKPRVFQQLTGLKIEEFDKLKGAFQKASEEEEPRESPAGRKAVLRTYEDQLFFILSYLRHYPTQEVLGFLFGISQGQANQWIHRLTPIVKKALGDRAYASQLLQDTIGPQDFFEKTRVQSGGEALL